MVYLLMLSIFVVCFIVSIIIANYFRNSIDAILRKIIVDDIYSAWHKYMLFAIYVVGISSGVKIWNLERFLNPIEDNCNGLVLDTARWIIEVYRAIIGSLTGIAWLLLIFFIVCLVIVSLKKVFIKDEHK